MTVLMREKGPFLIKGVDRKILKGGEEESISTQEGDNDELFRELNNGICPVPVILK